MSLQPNNIALRLTLIYLFFSVMWIFGSDQLVHSLFTDAANLKQFQTLKGVFFVIISSVIIFLLINHQIQRKNKIIQLLNRGEKWNNKMISSLPDIDVYLFDRKLRYILANGGAMHKHGLSSEMYIGRRVSDLTLNIETGQYLERFYKKIIAGYDVSDILSYENHTYQLKGSPIRNDEQQIIAGLCVAIDVTKEEAYKEELTKAKELAEHNDRLKSAFLANMSHEVRTPLNSIVGFSGLLSKENLSQENKERYVAYIASSSKRLITVINDILDISKIETHQMALSATKFYVKELMKEWEENATTMLIEADKEKAIVLAIESDLMDHDEVIELDRERLFQILINFTSNAIKFTEKGFITLKCFRRENAICFSVRDSGIGIDKGQQAFIFERFRQVEESSNRRFGGSGLGLTITKGIAELMGGTISMDSNLGQGSEFIVSFPIHTET